MHEWRRWLPAAWSLALALLLLGPALGSGFVLTYDMVWVPDLALRPDMLGVGSGLPRAVPSDAVVAVLDELVPGALLQKVVLLGALVGAGLGAVRLAPAGSLPAALVAVSCYQWNPFVVERLLIGHWPVLLGYAALPWVVDAARRWRASGRFPVRLLWLLPLGSLSASAGAATALVLLCFAAGGGRTLRVLGLVLAANAPWLVSGLLHATAAVTDPRGAAAFALHGHGDVPAPLAALGLGGIWNAEVVLPSRTGPPGWWWLAALAVLAALGAAAWHRATTGRDRAAYAACWVAGTGTAVLTWAAPGAVAWAAAHVPGAGLVRDGARPLALAAPLLVALVAHGAHALTERLRGLSVARVVLGGALVLLPVAVLPDAALGAGGRLDAVAYPASYAVAREAVEGPDAPPGDVVPLPFTSYRQPAWNGDRKVLDPVGRVLPRDYVGNDDLVVSGVLVEGEDPRAKEVAAALAAPSPQDRARLLAEAGIGIVAVDRSAPGAAPEVAGEVLARGRELEVVAVAGAREPRTPPGWVVAMALAWAAFVAGPLAAVASVTRSAVGRRPGNNSTGDRRS